MYSGDLNIWLLETDTGLVYAIPSIFVILSVGFLLIEQNKGLVFNVYYDQYLHEVS